MHTDLPQGAYPHMWVQWKEKGLLVFLMYVSGTLMISTYFSKLESVYWWINGDGRVMCWRPDGLAWPVQPQCQHLVMAGNWVNNRYCHVSSFDLLLHLFSGIWRTGRETDEHTDTEEEERTQQQLEASAVSFFLSCLFASFPADFHSPVLSNLWAIHCHLEPLIRVGWSGTSGSWGHPGESVD